MPSRDQVRELLANGHSYASAAERLGVPAGQVYLIATGVPADGGDPLGPHREPQDTRRLAGSPQQLVNPRPVNPTRSQPVLDWVRARASRDLNGAP